MGYQRRVHGHMNTRRIRMWMNLSLIPPYIWNSRCQNMSASSQTSAMAPKPKRDNLPTANHFNCFLRRGFELSRRLSNERLWMLPLQEEAELHFEDCSTHLLGYETCTLAQSCWTMFRR